MSESEVEIDSFDDSIDEIDHAEGRAASDAESSVAWPDYVEWRVEGGPNDPMIRVEKKRVWMFSPLQGSHLVDKHPIRGS